MFEGQEKDSWAGDVGLKDRWRLRPASRQRKQSTGDDRHSKTIIRTNPKKKKKYTKAQRDGGIQRLPNKQLKCRRRIGRYKVEKTRDRLKMAAI